MLFDEKNINFNKNETESKLENPTHTLERWTLCFSSRKDRELKVKLWWVGARERKMSAFLYCLFYPKEIFVSLRFISMYSVLNKLSDTFTYQKTLLHTLLLLVFKMIESLQCILNPEMKYFSWNTTFAIFENIPTILNILFRVC